MQLGTFWGKNVLGKNHDENTPSDSTTQDQKILLTIGKNVMGSII